MANTIGGGCAIDIGIFFIRANLFPPAQMPPTTAQGIVSFPLRFYIILAQKKKETTLTSVRRGLQNSAHHLNKAEPNTCNPITATPVLHRVEVTSTARGLAKMRRTPTQIQQLPLLQCLLVHLQ